MLVFSTDMSVPKDVTSVGLYIFAGGAPISFGEYEAVDVGTGNYLVRFPSTFAVVSNGKASAPVRVQLVAYRRGPNGAREPLVLREAVTTVPTQRVAMLRMPLQWINQGGIIGQTATPGSLLKSDCPGDNQGYLDGACGSIEVDVDKLPDFSEAEVFGGGNASGDGGRCLDLASTFDNATTLPVDLRDCSAPLPADASTLNLAVEAKANGVCIGPGGAPPCYVVLDAQPSVGAGWTTNAGRVRFSPGLCRRLERGDALRVVAASGFPAKTERTPVCAPWGAPGSKPEARVADAGPILVPDGGRDAGDAGPNLDAGRQPENIGLSEPSLQRVAVVGNQLFAVAAHGKVISIDKDDVENRRGSLRVLRADGDPMEPNFGHSLAAIDTAGSTYVAVAHPGTQAVAPYNGGAVSFKIGGGTGAVPFSPALAGGTMPYTSSILGVAATTNGLYYAGQFSASAGDFGAFQILRQPPGAVPNGSAYAQNPPGASSPSQVIATDPANGDLYIGGFAALASDLVIVRCSSLNCSSYSASGGTYVAESGGNVVCSLPGQAAMRRFGAMTVTNDGTLYFTLVSNMPGPGAPSPLFQVPKAGGTPMPASEPLDFVGGPPTTTTNAIAADARLVYVTTGGDVRFIPRTGPNVGQSFVIAGGEPGPRGIAIDAQYVYYTTLGVGATPTMPAPSFVRRAPLP